jgi:hypothetical protein
MIHNIALCAFQFLLLLYDDHLLFVSSFLFFLIEGLNSPSMRMFLEFSRVPGKCLLVESEPVPKSLVGH